MEKKVNKYYILLGIYSFFGYFIGTTMFVVLGGQNSLNHSISGLLGASILAITYSVYYQKRFPGLNRKAEELVNDERTILVKGKSAVLTLNIIYMFLVIVMFIGMFIDNSWIRYTSAVTFLVINTTNWIVFKVFDKRM